MILGVFGFLIIIHRLCYYKFEYDEKFSPVDYGKFNILSFLRFSRTYSCTSISFVQVLPRLELNAQKGCVQSACRRNGNDVYFGDGARLHGRHPDGIYTAFSVGRFLPCNEQFYSSVFSYDNTAVYGDFVVFPFTNKRINHKTVWFFAIYPFVYSIFP